MRHPPSPLLLSARKRRPRRTPPRGSRTPAEAAPSESADTSSTAGADAERCVLVQPFPDASASDTTQSDANPPDASSGRDNRK